ncbi:Na+ dependent nucleoside transporter N-terminal domain-containing protein, partial [Trichlorobacter lovleyi]|uniref:Na+ dependent nucleoside transporter N-terminal domain-containing protein n=1 Tax=Trichlorobacter lovleyi TaxID=313985 RepID=UPI0023EFAF05
MLHAVVGMVVLLGVAWLLSENRRVIHWRLIVAGVALQVLIALLMLKAAPFRQLFLVVGAISLFAFSQYQGNLARMEE